MSLTRNIGSTDRIIRLALGIAVVILAATGVISGAAAVAGVVVGGVLIATSAVQFCPLYRLLGVSTCGAALRHR
jgi:hypothetical protein